MEKVKLIGEAIGLFLVIAMMVSISYARTRKKRYNQKRTRRWQVWSAKQYYKSSQDDDTEWFTHLDTTDSSSSDSMDFGGGEFGGGGSDGNW